MHLCVQPDNDHDGSLNSFPRQTGKQFAKRPLLSCMVAMQWRNTAPAVLLLGKHASEDSGVEQV